MKHWDQLYETTVSKGAFQVSLSCTSITWPNGHVTYYVERMETDKQDSKLINSTAWEFADLKDAEGLCRSLARFEASTTCADGKNDV